MHPSLILYNSLLGLASFSALPALSLASLFAPLLSAQRGRAGLQSHFPFTPNARRGLWMQAASVGEVNLAASILAAGEPWPSGKNITLTSGTPQGLAQAYASLGDKVQAGMFPLDFPWAVKAAVSRIRPQVYVSLETEIWPNMLWHLHKIKVKTLMLNGRISPRSYPGYMKIRPLIAPCLQTFSCLGMISREDAERVVSLGADPARVVVTGNAKYGWLSARCQATDLSVPSRRLNLAGSPFIVAGSVRSGEEDMLFRAFARTRAQAEGAVLLAAPRHLRQVEKWRRAALYHGFKADCWSRIKCREPELAVIILDEMGPLFELYGLADSAFVGGSLVDKGGHNPLEPAVWGKPLAYGPHMQDFKDALACLPANMARMVASGEQLADFWLYCLSRREMAAVWQRKGQAMAASLNQASRRAAQLIKQHLV